MSENEIGIPLSRYSDKPVRRIVGVGSWLFCDPGRLMQIVKTGSTLCLETKLRRRTQVKLFEKKVAHGGDVSDITEHEFHAIAGKGLMAYRLLTIDDAAAIAVAIIREIDIPQLGVPLSEIFAEPVELPTIVIGTFIYHMDTLYQVRFYRGVSGVTISRVLSVGNNPVHFIDNKKYYSGGIIPPSIITELFRANSEDILILTPAQAAVKFAKIVGDGK